MTDELLTHVPVDRIELRAESDGRTVDIRMVPWGVVAETDQGREVFTRGAFADCDPELVTIESGRHGGALVGRGSAITEGEDAAYLTARISDVPDGNALLTLIRDGVYRRASIAFAELKGGTRRRSDGVIERTRVDLRRVAVLERGAYPGAEVLAIRREAEMTEGAELITTVAPEPVDLSPINDRLERMETSLGTLMTVGREPRMEYRAQTLGELLHAAWADPTLKGALSGRVSERALADQIVTDNPGLVPPARIRDAAVIVGKGRATIDGIGTGPLPATGMTVSWPVLTTALTGLIAKQTTEKAAVVSAKVSFGSGTSAIQTFAGASDVGKQLSTRSDPPYLEQYARVMLAAWASVTDIQYLTDLIAGATGGTAIITPASNLTAVVAALVDASLKVQAETGQPASYVGVASDLFAAIAKLVADKSINPTSAAGTALASTLTVNISGLVITHDPNLGPGTGIITNSIATQWLEDGPFQISVEDAEKVGDNVAYWSLGASALYVPKGIVKIAAA